MVGGNRPDRVRDAGAQARELWIRIIEREHTAGGVGYSRDSVLVGGIDTDIYRVAVAIYDRGEIPSAIEDTLCAVFLEDSPLGSGGTVTQSSLVIERGGQTVSA